MVKIICLIGPFKVIKNFISIFFEKKKVHFQEIYLQKLCNLFLKWTWMFYIHVHFNVVHVWPLNTVQNDKWTLPLGLEFFWHSCTFPFHAGEGAPSCSVNISSVSDSDIMSLIQPWSTIIIKSCNLIMSSTWQLTVPAPLIVDLSPCILFGSYNYHYISSTSALIQSEYLPRFACLEWFMAASCWINVETSQTACHLSTLQFCLTGPPK